MPRVFAYSFRKTNSKYRQFDLPDTRFEALLTSSLVFELVVTRVVNATKSFTKNIYH